MKFAFFATLAFAIIIPILIMVGIGNNQDLTSGSESSSIAPPTIVNGKQIIEISAKGGYTPRETKAKANIPSIIRMKTRGTFDCSSSLIIPTLKYASYLPATGTTDIEVPPQQPGTTLQAMCGMGMYSFDIQFI